MTKQFYIPQELLLNYPKLGLTEINFVALLQIMYQLEYLKKEILDISILANITSMDIQQMRSAVAELIEKGILIVNNKDGQDLFSINPIWENRQETKVNKKFNIVMEFENLYGRLLTPIEMKNIERWLATYPRELIMEATQIAVEQEKGTLAYIGSILERWKREGIKTLTAVKADRNKFDNKNNKEKWSEKGKYDDLYQS